MAIGAGAGTGAPDVRGPSAAGRLYSPGTLAEALGWGVGRTPEQRMRRYLARRERMLNVSLHVRVGTALRIVLPLVKEHCPELFDARREMEALLRERLEQIEDRVAQLGQNDDRIASTLTALGTQLASGVRKGPR